MVLKELVLIGQESFADYEIQGKVKPQTLTRELYLELADKEVESYYLDINKETNQPYMSIKLES